MTFEIGKKYTIFRISGMAITFKSEILITGTTEVEGDPIFKFRGKRKLFILRLKDRAYSSAPVEDFEGAVFLGWDQPIKCDSELFGASGTTMRGNACYNFAADPDEVRAWIETGQLNPAFDRSKVLATGRENNKETVVYPELYGGGHAVIERVLNTTRG